MAFVLICLILTFITDDLLYLKIAIVLLVINMTFPVLFRYPACLWFGFSHLAGSIISTIILTMIYFIIVMPVSLIRRLLGFDPLMLGKFKKDSDSVMVRRDVSFTREDLEKPY